MLGTTWGPPLVLLLGGGPHVTSKKRVRGDLQCFHISRFCEGSLVGQLHKQIGAFW